jgi:hypothetical protein
LVEGNCPLHKEEVVKNIEQFRGRIVIIRLPEVNNEIIDLLKSILGVTILVLLINPEQKITLDKQLTFRRLPHHNFPKSTLELFFDLAKVFHAESIVTDEAFRLIARLSNGNPGAFVTNLKLVFSELELAGLTSPATPVFVAEKLESNIPLEQAIEIIAEFKSGWVSVEEVRHDLLINFNMNITNETIGKRLKKLRLTFRKNPAAEYYFPNQSHLLLTNGTNGSNGFLDSGSVERLP